MTPYRILAATALSIFAAQSFAADFFSTEESPRLFNFGVRLGVNASNRTFSKDYFNEWNVNSWGAGIDAGIVMNINIREYLAIQPGFFFESRSGHYAYSENYVSVANQIDNFTQLGKLRTYNFTIPVMASFRFNLADNLKWLVEAGPYVQLKLHSSDNQKIEVISQSANGAIERGSASSKFADWGLKAGTGIMVADHYSFSIHYLAGGCDVWKEPYAGGKNKAWTFTLGYEF